MCERDEMKKRCDCRSLYAIHEINIQQKRTSVFSCACPSHCKCSCTYCICTIKRVPHHNLFDKSGYL